MDKKTVFIKTAKGENEGSNLSSDLKRILSLIDNKSRADELAKRAPPSLRSGWLDLLGELVEGGYIRDSSASQFEPKIATPKFNPLKMFTPKSTEKKSVYIKTAKGETETGSLSSDFKRILALVDSKSSSDELAKSAPPSLRDSCKNILSELAAGGYIRDSGIFGDEPKMAVPKTSLSNIPTLEPYEEPMGDLDFHTMNVVAKSAVEQKVDEDAAKKKQEEDERAELEAAVAAAKVRASAEALAKVEAKIKLDAEAAAREKALAEAEAASKAEAKAIKDAEIAARAKAEAKAQQEAAIRAQAEAKIKQEVAAKLQAEQEAARAKAALEAAMRVRAEIEAAARAQQIAEAKVKQEVAARLKAEQEAAQAKAALEVAAKAKVAEEARIRAEIEAAARAQQIAEANAKREAEAARLKMEQETVRIKAELEAAKTKAEADAKALAEARARQEAEEKARREAEAARLKAEKEAAIARAVAEAVEKAKREAEEKARKEAEAARIKAEQEAARIKAEQEAARIKAEQEAARIKAEQEAVRIRAEQEAVRIRAEQEAARIKAEQEARIKAEQETTRIIAEQEARIKAEQEALAQLRAEVEIKAAEEARARIEEAVRREAEEQRVRTTEQEALESASQSGATPAPNASAFEIDLDSFKAGMNTAPKYESPAAHHVTQPIVETEAKNTQQQTVAAAESAADRASINNAAAEMARLKEEAESARLKMEEEKRRIAEERMLAEEQSKAWAEAEQRAKAQAVIEAEQAVQQAAMSQARSTHTPSARTHRKPLPWGKMIFSLAILALLAVIVLPYVYPLEEYISPLEMRLTALLKQPVHIGKISASSVPPKLQLSNVTVGNAQEVKVGTIVLNFDLLTLFTDVKAIENANLQDVSIQGSQLDKQLASLKQMGGDAQFPVRHLTLQGVKILTDEVVMPPLSGIADIDKGAFNRIALHSADDKFGVDLQSAQGRWQLGLAIKEGSLPILPDVMFSDFSAKGDLSDGEINFTEMDAHIFNGILTGGAKFNWRKGWQLQGHFEAKTFELAKMFTKYHVDGDMYGEGTFLLSGAKLSQMDDSPHIDGSFNVKNGSVNGFDMVETARLLSTENLTGGRTHFDEMIGLVQLDNHVLHFRQLKIVSGMLSANGMFDVSTANQLSGNFNAEIKMRAGNNPLTLYGTPLEPKLRASN